MPDPEAISFVTFVTGIWKVKIAKGA